MHLRFFVICGILPELFSLNQLPLAALSKVQPQAFTIILDNVRSICFSTAKCNPINLRHCQNHNKRPLIFRKKRGPVHDVFETIYDFILSVFFCHQ